MGLSTTYKIPQPRGYSQGRYYIEDRSETSPNYFDIVDFPMVVGGGRHVIKVKGDGLNLRMNSTIDVEIIDEQGQRIFAEVLDYIDRFSNFYIAIEIYDITAQGIATAYFVGEAAYDQKGNPVPEQYRDQYNVRWIKQFNVLPFERNNAEIIFDQPPKISIAQVVIPSRIATSNSTSGYRFVTFTSSIDQFAINDTSFKGYDRDFASSVNILDPRSQDIQVNPDKQARTVNSVPTVARTSDNDIVNGSYYNYTTRFTTRLQSTSSFFTKQHLGAYFEFFNSSSVPTNLGPTLPSIIEVSGSIVDQLTTYKATIVEVVNATQVILDTPLQIECIDNSSKSRNKELQFTYKNASNFTASISYVPTTTNYITSSTISDSYVEVTFTDLKPISGDIYRIRTSTKFGDTTGDYKLLNDQIIRPVEYLTDAEFPNGVNHTRHDSDYRMIGHFTTQSIIDTYWEVYQETPSEFNIVSGSVSNIVQSEAAVLRPQYSHSAVLTTAYDQNYNENQTYIVSAYLTLDPYTEVEVYMTSEPLNTYLLISSLYPKAFNSTLNQERIRYGGDYNRFGKYVGKVVNDRPTRKYYGKVLFDFQTDGSGFGNPLFRAKVIDQMNITGSAYLSEISIKPYTLPGFTPSIIQYAVPLPQELVLASQLSQSIDFKIEYLDYTGKQSEYITYIDDLVLNFKSQIPSNTCQDDKVFFVYNSANFSVPTQSPPRVKG